MKKLLLLMLVGLLCLAGCGGAEELIPLPQTPLVDRIAAVEGELVRLASKVASAPDVSAIQGELSALKEELSTLRSDVVGLGEQMVALAEQIEALENGGTDGEVDGNGEVDEITRWSLEAWTDYVSSDFLDIDVEYKRIDEEDSYTIYIELCNTSIGPGGKHLIARVAGSPVEPPPSGSLYHYNTIDRELWQVVNATWVLIPVNNYASIYNTVAVTEVTLAFRPRSKDRVVVDEDNTYLGSYGLPILDWDLEFTTRDDGTCRRMEATAFTGVGFVVPVPSGFTNNDPADPYPTRLKLEFELEYK